jgi:glutamyl-tRNA reductase
MSDFSIDVIGVNYYSAPLRVLESVAFGRDAVVPLLSELKQIPRVQEVVLLSTCNRTEIYCCAERDSLAPFAIRRWLLDRSAAGGLEERHVYHHMDQDAVRHLFAVVCGLDSMVLGETEIIGQVQQALNDAVDAGCARSGFISLFNAAFRTGHRARAETEIDRGTTSVASAAVHMARRVAGELSDVPALVIGAGDTGTLVTKYLKEQGARVCVVNRTMEKARGLAACMGGRAAALDGLEEELALADVVIACTSSPHPLVSQEMVERVQKRRHGRILCMVDICVPHNVEPGAADVSNVFCSTMSDIEEVVKRNLAKREAQKPLVAAIIAQEADRFERARRTLEVGPLIQRLRDSFEELRREELARFAHRIEQGDPAAAEDLTRSLTNKLLHFPTLAIRDLAQEGEAVEKARWLERLFGLDKDIAQRRERK